MAFNCLTGFTHLLQSRQLPTVSQCRLNRSEDFKQTFQKGCKLRGRYFTVYTRVNCLNYPRLGIAITKKAVPKATLRNRLKRIVRESFRHKRELLMGLDIVVVVSVRREFINSVLWQELNAQWLRLNTQFKGY